MRSTLMAYNWGEGNLMPGFKTGRGLKGQAMPAETQQYADKVMRNMGGNVADFDPARLHDGPRPEGLSRWMCAAVSR